ncbi:FecR family protein [Chitinophaga lutea]
MPKQELQDLFEKLVQGKMTTQEIRRMESLLHDGQNARDAQEMIASYFVNADNATIPLADRKVAFEDMIRRATEKEKPLETPRTRFLRRDWLRYAAAILVICVVGAYFWKADKPKPTLATGNKASQTDILPGGNRAVLKLADGSEIILDSAADGNIARQGNAAIVKLAGGQIAYNPEGQAQDDALINTMITPRGGQYQLTLPDGTRAWLNAASSIQFPVAFTGATRSVKITGEVYFEVSKDEQKPFVVDVNGKSTIQVLGTSFDVNGYEDDGGIRTALVEGSVRVVAGNSQVVLKPGYEAIGNESKILTRPADLDQALAWKNGLFNLEGLQLPAVMRQLERWYDVDVRYEGPVPSNVFRGKMYRSVKLSTVLERFRDMGINCKIEGNTVVVMP